MHNWVHKRSVRCKKYFFFLEENRLNSHPQNTREENSKKVRKTLHFNFPQHKSVIEFSDVFHIVGCRHISTLSSSYFSLSFHFLSTKMFMLLLLVGPLFPSFSYLFHFCIFHATISMFFFVFFGEREKRDTTHSKSLFPLLGWCVLAPKRNIIYDNFVRKISTRFSLWFMVTIQKICTIIDHFFFIFMHHRLD